MLFDTFDRVGKAEFEYPKQVVFRALCEVVKELQGMSIDSQDDVASRLEIKTGMSAFSWGEKVSISLRKVRIWQKSLFSLRQKQCSDLQRLTVKTVKT